MLRISTTYLLIAIVLIAPQLCLGDVGDAVDAGGSCCCAKHHDCSGGETPQSPEENEPDCLCKGAVMDNVRSTGLELSALPAVDRLIDDAIQSPTALSLADTSSPV